MFQSLLLDMIFESLSMEKVFFSRPLAWVKGKEVTNYSVFMEIGWQIVNLKNRASTQQIYR